MITHLPSFTKIRYIAQKGKEYARKGADKFDTCSAQFSEFMNQPFITSGAYKRYFKTDILNPPAIPRNEAPFDAYKKALQKIFESPFFTCASEDSRKLLTDYFTGIGKADPLRLKRISDSKIMQTTSKNINEFAQHIYDKKMFFSKNMARMYEKKAVLREYSLKHSEKQKTVIL